LVELLDKHEEDWPEVLKEFNNTRIKDTNAIADLALYNFIEMRDRVADEQFLWRKEIEKQLQIKHKGEYYPLYSLVTFSHTPYSEAFAEGKRQDEVFKTLFENHENVTIEGVEKALGLI
jgi:kynurenine 3-monooxygenase